MHQTLDKALASAIGASGISDELHASALRDVEPALARLRGEATSGALALLGLPAETGDLAETVDFARRLSAGATDILLLGTGGSSLGGQTLAQLADHAVPGLGRLAKGPRLHFLDNLDPLSFGALLERLPLATTKAVAISKSGGTGETLTQTMALITALTEAGFGGEIGSRIFGLSEPVKPGGRNALRALLEPYGSPFIAHHTGVGGRYSILTNVGLLPAALLGLDIAAIRAGAGRALTPILAGKSARDIPAASGAALNIAAAKAGKGIAVLMGYGDRFERLARWWVQLWAESLGKDSHGTQPVAALGPVDQHSQQQLYLAGPADKLFTVMTLDVAGTGPRIDAKLAAQAGEPGFAGKTIGDLVAAQGLAMIDTFAARGCPVRHIHLPSLNEASMGELLMHFMLETILAGYAMGIDPFDQPAVEEAKLLAKRYLAEGRA
ncbi:MAG: glucose-6-phosphate isomerase [Bosea sp. (in: a-proteobacteria)]